MRHFIFSRSCQINRYPSSLALHISLHCCFAPPHYQWFRKLAPISFLDWWLEAPAKSWRHLYGRSTSRSQPVWWRRLLAVRARLALQRIGRDWADSWPKADPTSYTPDSRPDIGDPYELKYTWYILVKWIKWTDCNWRRVPNVSPYLRA